MRELPSGRRDRVLAAIEIPALGVWLGALAGFAFVSAPLAFKIVAPLDIGRFAALTAESIAALTPEQLAVLSRRYSAARPEKTRR